MLKVAELIPLYKKDDKLIMNNYRPISLLALISKLFEKVAFEQSSDFFQSITTFMMANMALEKSTRPNWLLLN